MNSVSRYVFWRLSLEELNLVLESQALSNDSNNISNTADEHINFNQEEIEELVNYAVTDILPNLAKVLESLPLFPSEDTSISNTPSAKLSNGVSVALSEIGQNLG